MNKLSDFQTQAARTAFVKMLKGRSFNICDLDNLAELLNRKEFCSGQDYVALRNLHCVDYGSMGSDLTMMVREKCAEILGLSPVIDVEPDHSGEAPTKNKPSRLLWFSGHK